MLKLFAFSFILLFLLAFSSFAQKIEKDEVDEFTKKSIKQSSWEKLAGGGGFGSKTFNFRISKINETVIFELKMMLNGDVYSVKKDDKLIFLFENGETIELLPIEAQVTCKGCGAVGFTGSAGYGTHTQYILSKSDIEKLSSNKIEKLRIYTSDGYVEDKLKKNSQTVIDSINLII